MKHAGDVETCDVETKTLTMRPECSRQWIEITLMAAVFLGEMCSLKWDGGWLQKLVENLAESGEKKSIETNGYQKIESFKGGADVEEAGLEVVDEKVENEKTGAKDDVEA